MLFHPFCMWSCFHSSYERLSWSVMFLSSSKMEKCPHKGVHSPYAHLPVPGIAKRLSLYGAPAEIACSLQWSLFLQFGPPGKSCFSPPLLRQQSPTKLQSNDLTGVFQQSLGFIILISLTSGRFIPPFLVAGRGA